MSPVKVMTDCMIENSHAVNSKPGADDTWTQTVAWQQTLEVVAIHALGCIYQDVF